MKNLIGDIKAKLNITGGFFVDAEIESYIKNIHPSDHLRFFKALSREHRYLKPMQVVQKVALEFTPSTKQDMLLATTQTTAKAMYNKFYDESRAMLEYCTANRAKIASDREFFIGINYKELRRVNGTKVYSKQELYVLNELGGGNWLIDIRHYENSNVVISRIESIIKKGIEKKYSTRPTITNKQVKVLLQKEVA